MAVVALRLIATERIVEYFQQAAIAVGARAFRLVSAFGKEVWHVRICKQGPRHRHTVEGAVSDSAPDHIGRLKATGA